MQENPGSFDWATSRGEKWRNQLSGMEAMLDPVDEPLIDALGLDAPCRIADVGCGGGGTTLKIHRRAPSGSTVHGFDISPDLIEEARGRRGPGESDIDFTLADVMTAPTPHDPYDRLVSRFGTMFYPDPPTAFANLARWLAPGGRFVFAVWGPPAENSWMTALRDEIAEVVDVPSPDTEAPGPFRYAGADKLLDLLGRAGLGELDARDWRGTLAIGGGLPAAEAVRFALESFSVARLLDDAETEVLEAVRHSLAARFSRHLHDGVVRMDAHVHLVTGARPEAG